jgi:crotonobetainyl-CoA:carnitine CoA-transferase CaiB-like acyl-CoA transferase
VTVARQPGFGPLQGVRVLDLTIALAGAFSTMLLADLGAEVLKVESIQHYPTPTKGPRNPARGDDPVSLSAARDYPQMDPGADPWNRLSWFNAQARNKRDVTMDLTRNRGRETFLQLVERSNGLIENNPPGLLEKLGLAPNILLERNPGFVIVRMPPLGLSGPDMDTTGFGWHFEDLGGFLRVQGYPDGEEVGSIFMDGASGPAGANAFLMGLMHSRATGTGGVCEVAQVENMICHIGDLIMDAAMNHRVPTRWGNRSPDFVPQGAYRCVGEDNWVVLSVRDEAEWAGLRTALGDPLALAPVELTTVEGRRANLDKIDAVISTWTAGRDRMEVFHVLQSHGVPAGPVLNEEDASGDPQLHERGFFQMLEHPSAGLHLHAGPNFQLSKTPLELWRAAPTLGQDNEYVYKELLGVADEEYADLAADGHIGDTYL